MRHARPLPFSRLDATLLAIVAALALASAVWADFEREGFDRWYLATFPAQYPARVKREHRAWSRWPYWVQDRRLAALRVLHDVRAFLIVTSLGLGLLTFRPRAGVRRGRAAPGHVASAIAAVLVVLGVIAVVRAHWLDSLVLGWLGKAPPADPYETPWLWLAWEVGSGSHPGLTIIAAWLLLAALGPRGRPIDPYDRAGRWLGWAWIVQGMADWFTSLIGSS